MKRVLQTLFALTGLGAVAAVAMIGLGLYNVSARQGHLPGVGWVLHTTFQQSVRLRAPDPKGMPADINDPDRIELGALHFATGCAFCHAAPGQPRSATALAMNPTPPHITDAVTHWDPSELFWIIREGVKMSGMPHWPAEGREDEIWSVVAYLNAVRNGSATDALTGVGPAAAVTCSACHGPLGGSSNQYIPRLDILTETQIAQALTQYRDGTRSSGVMAEAARGLTDQQISTLARKMGRPGPAPFAPLPASVKRTVAGRLATQGTEEIPACTACHGPDRQADTPIAPSLTGQSEAYLAAQLKLWRDGKRGGGERANLMRKAARSLNDHDIDQLAHWFATLDAETRAQTKPPRSE